MPYADSDFFIALLKEDDWLKKKAETILKEYKNKIWTSNYAIIEMLLLSKKFGLDPEKIVASIVQIARVNNDISHILSAAHLMKEKNMTTFDALHAVCSKNDIVISSDEIFEKIGLKRIKLEE